MTTEVLLSVGDVADVLQVPRQTLYYWRTVGEGPRAIHVGRHLRYRPADVARWIETRERA